MKLTLIICLMSLFIITPGFSQSIEEAQDDLSFEMSQCAAFYIFSSSAPNIPLEQSESLRDLGHQLLDGAAELSSEEMAQARFEFGLQSIGIDMEHHWQNYSTVLDQYGHKCKEIFDSPKQRLDFWLTH